MAVKLDREQRRTLRKALREADSFGASPLERKALVEALGTEATYRNPRGGDGTSVGPLQEIDAYGSVKRRRNTTLSTRRFLTEARAIRQKGFKGRAGALAQAVQRSGYPDRYEQRSGEADAILAKFGGGGSLRSKMGGATSSSAVPGFDPGSATQLLAQPAPRPSIPTSSLQAPSFSAQAPVAQGYTPVDAGGGLAPRPSLSDALSTQGQPVSFGSPAQQQQGSGAGGASSRRGKVKVEPGADRPGVPTNPEVTDFLKGVAGRTGRTVRVGTGSRHSQMTVNGNVSDHWTGRAADVPATGQRLIELGQAALEEAGWSKRRARKAKGGLYNVKVRGKRVQIIFNTHEGGDHTNHLHVGFGE